MSVFVTSDIHFNHKNILQYCPARRHGRELCTDEAAVWGQVAEMNETIIRNWNDVVSAEDEVWILGDVAMGQIYKAPALISRLNGKKHLIKGNHDKTLVKHIREGESVLAIKDLFVSVNDYWELTYKYGTSKVMICMSHYPMQSWNGMRADDSSSIHFHGHLHGTPSGLSGRIKDVGLDTNNLYPYLLDSVIDELIKIETGRDHHGKEM